MCKIFKTIALCATLCGSASALNAQSYINVGMGGGISTLRYSSADVSSDLGMGGALNVDFNYFFNDVVGFSVGAGFSMSNAAFSLDKTISTMSSYYSYNEEIYRDFSYDSQFDGWKEKQNLLSVDIPVGVITKIPLKSTLNLMVDAGLVLHFPEKATYEVTDGTRTTTANYSDMNLTISDVPHQGLYTLDADANKQKGDVKTKTVSAGLYADLGLMHDFNGKLFYYAIYGSFGLTSVTANNGGEWINQNGEYISPLNSSDVDKARMLGFGLKVGMKFPLRKNSGEEKE